MMFRKLFPKKLSKERIARATEHESVQRGQMEAKARAQVVLKRLDEKKRITKSA